MRIDLGRLSASDLRLETPALQPENPARALDISSADDLRGAFVTSPSGWQLVDVTATRIALARLLWQFGGLSLTAPLPCELREVKANVGATAAATDIGVELGQLVANRIEIRLGALQLSAAVEARGLRLAVREGVGLLTAEQASFRSLELRSGALHAVLPELNVTQLVIDWGGDEFRLEAGSTHVTTAAVKLADTRIDASAVELLALRVLGGQVRIGQAQVGQLDVTAAWSAATPSAAASESTTKTSAARFDYNLLDGLAGHIHVDVAVDLTVPIIGHRRATHRLRIPVERGSLNYRQLEHNLAPLEDALIDFSVRDGALVLERGIPLLSTRGHGKPILVWKLSPEDLALAEQHRVRLAVLPTFQPADAPAQTEPEPSGGGGIKLRHLSAENADLSLSLVQSAGGTSGLIHDLTFAGLTVLGAVHHDAEGPVRAGVLDVGLQGLHTTLGDVPVGTQSLSGRVELAVLRDARIAFEDIRPTKLVATLERLTLADVALTR